MLKFFSSSIGFLKTNSLQQIEIIWYRSISKFWSFGTRLPKFCKRIESAVHEWKTQGKHATFSCFPLFVHKHSIWVQFMSGAETKHGIVIKLKYFGHAAKSSTCNCRNATFPPWTKSKLITSQKPFTAPILTYYWKQDIALEQKSIHGPRDTYK